MVLVQQYIRQLMLSYYFVIYPVTNCTYCTFFGNNSECGETSILIMQMSGILHYTLRSIVLKMDWEFPWFIHEVLLRLSNK